MAVDPLRDVSEPEPLAKIERFKVRISESPLDRALTSLAYAIDDVNAALWCAGSPEAQAEVVTLAEESITKLTMTIAVALTLQEHGL